MLLESASPALQTFLQFRSSICQELQSTAYVADSPCVAVLLSGCRCCCDRWQRHCPLTRIRR